MGRVAWYVVYGERMAWCGKARGLSYGLSRGGTSGPLDRDPLWLLEVYRLALFAAAKGWQDVVPLVRDRRTGALADQLARALGSISANIAEGYGRSSLSEFSKGGIQ